MRLLTLFLLPLFAQEADFGGRLTTAALERTEHRVIYNGACRRIPYPMGDVPDHIGVYTDVVIRSYRKLGIDLQQLMHEDMRANFRRYPNTWGLSKPDTNIDHRRVPNLEVFFARQGKTLPRSRKPADYRPGDIVTWRLPGNLPHIGIVTHIRTRNGVPLVVHNVGWGPKLEDYLFRYPMVGHYRFGRETMQSYALSLPRRQSK